MKSPISLLILLTATVAFAESPETIQRVTLDEHGLTLINFPRTLGATCRYTSNETEAIR